MTHEPFSDCPYSRLIASMGNHEAAAAWRLAVEQERIVNNLLSRIGVLTRAVQSIGIIATTHVDPPDIASFKRWAAEAEARRRGARQ